MPPMRPVLRPSIRDLTTFLFQQTPQKCISRQCLRTNPQLNHSIPRTTLRGFSLSTSLALPPKPLPSDRGPPSSETTQTDFGSMDVLANTPPPSTTVDACLWDGFHLNSGVKITGGSGALLVGGEAFCWRPWKAGKGMKLINEKGQWEVGDEAWGLLGLVWPKPDLLILGLGKEMRPLSPRTRQFIMSLGIRVDIQDTRNAAAQFNLLATERGVGSVAAALVPFGWVEGAGVNV